jgi:hypothetical protein
MYRPIPAIPSTCVVLQNGDKFNFSRILPFKLPSRDSVVGIATGYGLDDRGIGVQIPIGSRIFSSPRLSDRLWGPPNLLSNGYWELFPGDKAAGA